MNVLDKNGKILNKFDTVSVVGDAGLWVITSFNGNDVNLQKMDGSTLTRMAQNVAKLST